MHSILFAFALLAAPKTGGAVVTVDPQKAIPISAGKLTRELVVGEDKPARLVLDGDKVLYGRDGDLEPTYLLPDVDGAGSDVVLTAVHSDEPALQGCTKYVFVTVHKDGTAQASDEFGDCSDQFKIERAGGAATVRFHDATWRFENGAVSQLTTKKKRSRKR